MQDLNEIRKEIDQLDQTMTELFEMRMQLAEKVAFYKSINHLPIFDAEREKQILENRSDWLDDPKLLPYFQEFLRDLMRISKQYQKDLLQEKTSGDEVET